MAGWVAGVLRAAAWPAQIVCPIHFCSGVGVSWSGAQLPWRLRSAKLPLVACGMPSVHHPTFSMCSSLYLHLIICRVATAPRPSPSSRPTASVTCSASSSRSAPCALAGCHAFVAGRVRRQAAAMPQGTFCLPPLLLLKSLPAFCCPADERGAHVRRRRARGQAGPPGRPVRQAPQVRRVGSLGPLGVQRPVCFRGCGFRQCALAAAAAGCAGLAGLCGPRIV